jgi:hypothetical protein
LDIIAYGISKLSRLTLSMKQKELRCFNDPVTVLFKSAKEEEEEWRFFEPKCSLIEIMKRLGPNYRRVPIGIPTEKMPKGLITESSLLFWMFNNKKFLPERILQRKVKELFPPGKVEKISWTATLTEALNVLVRQRLLAVAVVTNADILVGNLGANHLKVKKVVQQKAVIEIHHVAFFFVFRKMNNPFFFFFFVPENELGSKGIATGLGVTSERFLGDFRERKVAEGYAEEENLEHGGRWRRHDRDGDWHDCQQETEASVHHRSRSSPTASHRLVRHHQALCVIFPSFSTIKKPPPKKKKEETHNQSATARHSRASNPPSNPKGTNERGNEKTEKEKNFKVVESCNPKKKRKR